MYRSIGIRNRNYIVDVLSAWKKYLPMITPYYAIKAYSDPLLIEQIADHKCGFEYASRSELDMVLEYNNPVLFSNPVKHTTDIIYSKQRGRHVYVVDSIEEILKIHSLDKDAIYIIRISAHDSFSEISFNTKFGACKRAFHNIIEYMYHKGIIDSIKGISYHVGSRCNSMSSHVYTFDSIFNVYMPILHMYGTSLNMINIGGGFTNVNQLYVLRKLLERYLRYCSRNHIKLIAEPGRLFCEGYLDILTKIIAIRKYVVQGKDVLYITINDSVYHTFQGKIYDQQVYMPQLISNKKKSRDISIKKECIIFGQTCDSIDVICENAYLENPCIGDMLLFENMGAYSLASSNGKFNGFESARVI